MKKQKYDIEKNEKNLKEWSKSIDLFFVIYVISYGGFNLSIDLHLAAFKRFCAVTCFVSILWLFCLLVMWIIHYFMKKEALKDENK